MAENEVNTVPESKPEPRFEYFLQLPLEIRMMIYADLLVKRRPITWRSPLRQGWVLLGQEFQTDILWTCRQVHEEALTIFLMKNKVRLSTKYEIKDFSRITKGARWVSVLMIHVIDSRRDNKFDPCTAKCDDHVAGSSQILRKKFRNVKKIIMEWDIKEKIILQSNNSVKSALDEFEMISMERLMKVLKRRILFFQDVKDIKFEKYVIGTPSWYRSNRPAWKEGFFAVEI
jgi:hypothetical protein